MKMQVKTLYLPSASTSTLPHAVRIVSISEGHDAHHP